VLIPARIGRRTALGLLAGGGVALGASPASAQLDKILRGLGGTGGLGSGLSDAKIGEALKEALQVATETTVKLTGAKDGFFLNQAIKILMPEKLRSLETGLRAVGYSEKIDQFVLSMNRAAERASTPAKSIFFDAIGAMTFDDGRKILNGGDHAATDYFKGKTTDKLTALFQPIVNKAMNEVDVTRQYKELVGRFQQMPFARVQSLDLDHYVTGKGLDGLFHVLADQEKQIRTNPAARATDLLKQVFGK
jgi:hypothetical protein